MGTKKRISKFSGLLAKPIRPLPEPVNAMLSEEALRVYREEQSEHVLREKLRRVPELLKRYGIRESLNEKGELSSYATVDLLMSMAEEFVPGFRVAINKTGRRKRWTRALQYDLIVDVVTEQERNKKLSQLGACMNLVKPGRRYHGYKGDSLYRIFQEAKQAFPGWKRFREMEAGKDETRRVAFHPKNQRDH